jgi:chromate transporter
MAVYAGFCGAGIPGGIVAALGLVSPAIIIIIIIARMLQAYKENRIVQAVFSGLRPAAAGLLCAACFQAIKVPLYNPAAQAWFQLLRWRECALFGLIFFLIRRFKAQPILYIAAAGIAGVLLEL